MNPRKEPEAERAIPMPDVPEPLAAPALTDNGSRQARRQAQRARMKAERRNGRPVTITATEPMTVSEQSRSADAPALPSLSTPPSLPELTQATDNAPLPRNRALTVQPRGLKAVAHWLRSLVMVRRPRNRLTQDTAVQQIRAMRAELNHMQQTLDRMLDGV